ncbi:MAG: FkbM family methyltransferase [Planctomycetota bacterium]|nr:MAG: FkbM family methyltransferase [Planctomycetota bacterium]
MGLLKSLRKRVISLSLTILSRHVRNLTIRPVSIDEHGVWFKTKYGFSVYSNLKDRILKLDVNPEWEEMESSFILHNLKDGDVFIDVGANIGYFSMLAAGQKAALVLAIEPIPTTYEILDMNIKYNRLTEAIQPLNIALGSRSHTAKFTYALGPKNHAEYQVNNIHSNLPTIDVTVVTLDSLLRSRNKINKVDFIKVDIEGCEYDFLLGAKKSIETFKPMIMMEIEEPRLAKYNATAQEVFAFMDSLGYKYLSVGKDSIREGTTYTEDLKKGRNFIFYTNRHGPTY